MDFIKNLYFRIRNYIAGKLATLKIGGTMIMKVMKVDIKKNGLTFKSAAKFVGGALMAFTAEALIFMSTFLLTYGVMSGLIAVFSVYASALVATILAGVIAVMLAMLIVTPVAIEMDRLVAQGKEMMDFLTKFLNDTSLDAVPQAT